MANVSNQLEWMNKHLVLLKYQTVNEAVEQEMFPATTDLLEIAENNPNSEDFLHELENRKEYKDACSFLAYNLHHRAAVWWSYICVLDLLKELKKAPAKPRDIDDIGKPKPFNLPEWAQKPEKPPYNVEEKLAEFRDFRDKAFAAHQERIKNIDPEIRKDCEEAIEIVMSEIRKEHGKDLFDLLNAACEKIIRDHNQDFVIDVENSPITKAKKELQDKIEASRKETIETIKASLPKVDLKAQIKNKRSALDSVYSYIVSPDEDNANNCLKIGNKGPDTPEGLLSLVAFWSFGDLAPKGTTVVKTPAGLLGNGINSLMLMLALAPGGEKKLKERYETYFKLGYEVAAGRNNWSKSVEEGKAPHAELNLYANLEKESGLTEEKAAETPNASNNDKPQATPVKPVINRFK